jgi:hypothetical protein
MSDLINMDDPRIVFREVKNILSLIDPAIPLRPLACAFDDIIRLFKGAYPGYRACTTEYHDLKHTTDVLLAMARLLHGAALAGRRFDAQDVVLGLICALFHDTGYIQTKNEKNGTGARFTTTHVRRSVDFMQKYFRKNGFSNADVANGRDIINCTAIDVKLAETTFANRDIALLGKMLGTADLLGQMADRTYLEKLLFLFYEFQEGNIGSYTSELDLLRKTMGVFDMAEKRFAVDLGNVRKYFPRHFKTRWKIGRDLYTLTVARNRKYLKRILDLYDKEYRQHLRRGGIVERLEKMGL